MDDTELTPLERVATAIQDFVNSIEDEAPVLLRGGVIAWESVIFNDQGQAMYKVNYASLPDTSMASTIGIMSLGHQIAVNDMTGPSDDD